MVLKIKAPKGVSCSRLIENVVSKRYSLPKVPLKKYYTRSQVSILLGVRESRVLPIAANSGVLHGAEWENEIYFHPLGVTMYVRSKMKEMVKYENKRVNAEVLRMEMMQKLSHR